MPISIRFGLRKKSSIIVMVVFQGILKQEPNLDIDQNKKYEDFRWEDGGSFMSQIDTDEIGDCIKSYRDLIKVDRIS